MKTMKIWRVALGLALLCAAPASRSSAGMEAANDPERVSRWKAISEQIFGDRRIEPPGALIKLDAPQRAEDAALVPVTLMMAEKDKIRSVYLVIDDNPSPLAAHITFGPAADPGSMQLRVEGRHLYQCARRGRDQGRPAFGNGCFRESLGRLLGAGRGNRRRGHGGHRAR